jgi:hypothetical protein
MGGFNLKMEDYPELKASENMMQLSDFIRNQIVVNFDNPNNRNGNDSDY